MSAVTFRFPFPVAGRPDVSPDLTPHHVDASLISVMDAAAERGDGAFEAFGVIAGALQATDDHLARLAESCALLELPEPDLDQLATICRRIAARATPGVESWLKLVVSRGGMDRSEPHAWAVLSETADFSDARSTGLAVIAGDRGFPASYVARERWMLFGAKTLSYAMNMASLREAKRRGADDMLWTTSDGFLMEAPQSTLVFRRGTTFCSPDPGIGILHGTTQRAVFRWAKQQGYTTEYGRYTRSDLLGADAAWFTSSVRLATPLISLDGDPLTIDHALTDSINAFLLARRD
ncbi:aminotransferase class IV [Microbacterium amylolyticum]|uniref:4-amino-4-deoxychorismate lyase n=1 Tax=Microbacterium amylolyticum TaxID=936337 RepID=A0ABS4ZH97_9MICO|nr:aminotransferase class IV [Microbacterium amylolyticum]MBP2436577.1 4-amino-4-deoxychorismate lyase [Microbacterium amylolyticum]